MSGPVLTRDELAIWSRYVHEICGVFLDSSKGYLIETRLSDLVRETGASSFTELLSKVRADPGQTLRRKVIDAITTNETSFFRDGSPFELLRRKLIPELIERLNRVGRWPAPIRIWSAACSTGQEAYSTAMVLKEVLGDFRGYDIRILGTDISDRAIAQASYAHFNRLELERGVTPAQWAQHFEPSGERWKVRDELRATASFRRLNLLEPFAFPVPFDLIFCRNVAIYFTEADKIRLFRNLGRCLDRNGALIIGATESLANLCPEFEPHRYQRTVFYRHGRTPA
ncbi:MAG: protein-glutamate O-methyltransferase CheR [Candidatus Contendobacter sp.]|nr:protein-glutamate O-methyltransferase CheR [Candidatus Contendobacter sp.]